MLFQIKKVDKNDEAIIKIIESFEEKYFSSDKWSFNSIKESIDSEQDSVFAGIKRPEHLILFHNCETKDTQATDDTVYENIDDTVYENNDDTIYGYIIYRINFDEAELLKICIDEKFRKKHYASRLLEYMIQDCYTKNVKKIFLEVRESNTNAIIFYTKNGFKQINIRKNYYSNPCENALVFEKILT